MRISVFGLGYVGCVTAACLAKDGHEVIGVDIDSIKRDAIHHGRSPIIEAGLEEVIQGGISGGSLQVTNDHMEAVLNTDASLICVGTPSLENGNIDLTHVRRVCRQIGFGFKQKENFHTVVLRSTILPGTTEQMLIPILERAAKKKAVMDFGVCVNPEFLRQGEAINDFYNPSRIIIGSTDDKTCNIVREIYKHIGAPVIHTDIRTAEFIKYVDNSFHALKICFANEIASISRKHGINSFKVMEIFGLDQKLNISRAYLRPGFAFGGSCLPKDVRAIVYQSRRDDLEVPLLDSIVRSNETQITVAVNQVLRTRKKRIGVLGLSFKAGTDDLRESPIVRLIEALIGKGLDIRVYDKFVSLARIFGANKAFITKGIPHIESLMSDSVEGVIEFGDVVVIASSQKEFGEVVTLLRKDQELIDLVGISGQT